jgi:hypothetical protein
LRAALLAAVGTVALLGPAAVAGGTSVAPQRVAARRAIDESFVAAFGVVMIAAAVVALAAAASGALIRPTRQVPSRR